LSASTNSPSSVPTQRLHFDAAQEKNMPKGQQRTNKESKKPKKDQAPSKPVSPFAVNPTVTTVVPDRSKKKP
jgi:hypothetical protein